MSSSELGPNLAQDVEIKNPEDEAMDTDNTDKNKHIATSLQHITHMPPTIKKKIFGELDAYSHKCVRQVCQSFKRQSDRSIKYYEQMKFEVKRKKQKNFIRVSLKLKKNKELKMEFHEHLKGYTMRNYAQKWKKDVIGFEDYAVGAVKFFSKVAFDEKVRIDEMTFDLLPLRFKGVEHYQPDKVEEWNYKHNDIMRAFDEELSRPETYMHPREVIINIDGDEGDVLTFIENMNPGTLERLTLRREGFTEHELFQLMNMKEIVETDQWRRLEEFHSDYEHPELNVDNVAHLYEYTINFGTQDVEEFKLIFKSCIDHEGPGCWGIDLRTVYAKYQKRYQTGDSIVLFGERLTAVIEMIGEPTKEGGLEDVWELKDPPGTYVELSKADDLFRIYKD